MGASLPDTADLPLFPLGTVLFPGGLLPLQIFEPRYLDLMGRCHREGRPFGVVTLTQGQEVMRAPGPGQDDLPEAFAATGTLAHILGLERPRPGLMLIRCEGSRRFRLAGQQRLKHGLWLGTVAEWLPPDPDLPVPPHLRHVAQAMQVLLDSWCTEMQSQGLQASALPLLPPHRPEDCGWLANRWIELLALGREEQLRLMSLDNPLLRLELVADLLEQAHGLVRPALD